jgi:predicted N-acyltransferase
MLCRFITSIHDTNKEQWNGLLDHDYPFLRHEFFSALEDSKSTSSKTGWTPHHCLLFDDDVLVAIMPLFIKTHSYGEYVFDWSWADAYLRSGLNYYPKLLNAIPFTPATGPRWAIDNEYDSSDVLPILFEAVEKEAIRLKASSYHCLFTRESDNTFLEEQGYLKRTGCQYHWLNNHYQSFDDFLSTFNSRKRKNLKKERQKVAAQNIDLLIKEGKEISENDWQHFYLFYHLTYFKRSGRQGYLTEEFFPLLAKLMSESIVMVQAQKDDDIVAAALCFKDSQTLYGRYWGCKEEFDQLHFEACYYQGIEYAIKHQLQRFDPGAQGEHKIQRGFTPVETHSYHWIKHDDFSDAIKRFVVSEEKKIHHYIDNAKEYLPFKKEQ